jgi:hypothetical protein
MSKRYYVFLSSVVWSNVIWSNVIWSKSLKCDLV